MLYAAFSGGATRSAPASQSTPGSGVSSSSVQPDQTAALLLTGVFLRPADGS